MTQRGRNVTLVTPVCSQQEFYSFTINKVPAYVCTDAFIYHVNGGTLGADGSGVGDLLAAQEAADAKRKADAAAAKAAQEAAELKRKAEAAAAKARAARMKATTK